MAGSSWRYLLALAAGLGLAACGGTSVKHVAGDDDTSGSGGTQGGTSGNGGTNSGSGGTATSPDCDDIRRQFTDELASIRSCNADSDCGQVLDDSSCGCALNLVARLDADASEFHELVSTTVDGEQCVRFGDACDCPSTNGFECRNGLCGYRHTTDPAPMCTRTPIGSMCVIGSPAESGYALTAGMPLAFTFRPAGCYSSSCTQMPTAGCGYRIDGDDFYVNAQVCLLDTSDSNFGCSEDCDGARFDCSTAFPLTEGTHTIHYEADPSLDVTIEVPSIVSGDGLCAGMLP